MSKFANRLDIGLFQATHSGHGIRREERPFREDERFDEIPGLAEHWKPGAVFVWLYCPRCKSGIQLDRVEGA